MYIFLDFETYYNRADKYSLAVMSAEAYVRDPRFDIHLLSVAVDNSDVFIVEKNDIEYALRNLPLNREDVYTVAQNAKFDMFIVGDHFKLPVAKPVCSRAMARWTGISRFTRESQEALCNFLGTGNKSGFIAQMDGRSLESLSPDEYRAYIEYCKSDTRDMRENVRAMLPHLTADCLDFIAMTTKMYSHPVFDLDAEMLREYYNRLEDEHRQAQQRLQHLFQFETTEEFMKALRSADKFSKMLEQLGGTVPMKVSPARTATKKRQLEDEQISLQGDPNRSGFEFKRLCEVERLLSDESNYRVMIPALAKNDLEFMALQSDPNPDIAALCTARAQHNSSIAMSRAKTFLALSERGKLPVPLEPFIAITGRYSGGRDGEGTTSDKLNLQNLAKRTGDKTLRKAIKAPDGYTVVSGDSSQCEVRVGAWVTCEQQIIDTFMHATDTDNYCELAGTIYNTTGREVLYWSKGEGSHLDKEKKAVASVQRDVGKEGILSSQYGAAGMKFGTRLLQRGIKLSYRHPDGTVDDTLEGHYLESGRIVKTYRGKYRNIVGFWGQCSEIIKLLASGAEGYFGGPDGKLFHYNGRDDVFGNPCPTITFPDGFKLYYRDLKYEQDKDSLEWNWKYSTIDKGREVRKKLYGGSLFNNLNQGFSFAILRWQALELNKTFPIQLNVHDEWTSVVRDDQVEACVAEMERCLKLCPPWAQGIPFDCEVGFGKSYGDV